MIGFALAGSAGRLLTAMRELDIAIMLRPKAAGAAYRLKAPDCAGSLTAVKQKCEHLLHKE